MFSLNPHHPVIMDMAVCIGGGKWSDLFQFLIKSLNTNASEGKALLNLKKKIKESVSEHQETLCVPTTCLIASSEFPTQVSCSAPSCSFLDCGYAVELVFATSCNYEVHL